MTLSRDTPSFAPAATAQNGAGTCWRIDAPWSGGAVVLPASSEGVTIGPDDELVFDVLPVAGVLDRYAATAIALDLEFTDGSRLSENDPRDQHGTLLEARAQGAAKRLWVDHWNRRVVDLAGCVGRTVAAVWVAVEAEVETTAFVGAVTVRPRLERPTDLLGWADARRGTHSSDRFSRGNTAPIVSVPHGGVFGLPMTDASVGNWPYRYQMSAPALEAFATSHIPSPWIGDRGVFQIMPSPLAHPELDRHRRALAFDRDSEQARPDSYQVELEGVSALVTAARHAVGMRFRSHRTSLSVVVDHLGEAVEARWDVVDGTLRLDLRLRERGGGPDHFVHAIMPGVATWDLTHRDGALRGFATFALNEADVLVGVSTIDVAQAKANAQTPGSIDDMRREAEHAWRNLLDRVEIPDAEIVSDDVLRSVAGSLARVFSYPNAHDEPGSAGPRYRSPVDGAVRAGTYASNNGFWDTYRTAWPLLALLTPTTAASLADGFVQHFTDAGWVARWSAPGPVDCMTGTTSDTVFAGLAALGVDLRLEEAYRSAVRHATVAASDPRVGRKGLRPALFRGYVDSRVHEGLSWTLDNAINDASTSFLARAVLQRTRDEDQRARLETEAEYFARRALSYRAVFHEGLGFFLGRREDGSWRVTDAEFDPAQWGHDYTETNAWGTAFTAPHDGAGLAELHGGEAGLGAALDALFATPETADPAVVGSYGFVIHEMVEARDVRLGMCGLSNQPAHHLPFMYCFAGRHDDAHRIVVEARDRLFVGSELGQGYPGDEDNGEMSAWYLFATLGLYPLVPGSGEFVVSPPLLPRVVLHPQGRAHPLEITAQGAGKSYVREVRIDGEDWDRITVPADRILRARHVEFVLSDTPTGWASATRPSSISTELTIDEPLRDLLAPVPQSVTDDEGEHVTVLQAGERVELALTHPGRIGLYTVTMAGEPGALPLRAVPQRAAWTLRGLTRSGDLVDLDVRDEEFDVPGQTRPFRPRPDAGAAPSGPEELVAVQLEAVGRLELVQMEVFEA
ncbi:GH92 family glycosyl hydrolase [Oerskovia jenensis]|uniref:GH92 family glycosyl hydrolase n=1 Tax=Oerskovia jenensis TaxID=162169 RepID=UPI0036DE8788